MNVQLELPLRRCVYLFGGKKSTTKILIKCSNEKFELSFTFKLLTQRTRQAIAGRR